MLDHIVRTTESSIAPPKTGVINTLLFQVAVAHDLLGREVVDVLPNTIPWGHEIPWHWVLFRVPAVTVEDFSPESQGCFHELTHSPLMTKTVQKTNLAKNGLHSTL